MSKKRVSKHVVRKTVRKAHDPLNTPLIRVVVVFVLGATFLLIVYKLLI